MGFQLKCNQQDLLRLFLANDCFLIVHLRNRWGIGRLRKPTTDCPPLSSTDWDSVNVWRSELLQIQKDPQAWGVGTPSGWSSGISEDLMIGIDETPLLHVLGASGTYITNSEAGTYIAGESDRRQATAAPCTNQAGELVTCQLIWRGKTPMCLPSLSKEVASYKVRDL